MAKFAQPGQPEAKWPSVPVTPTGSPESEFSPRAQLEILAPVNGKTFREVARSILDDAEKGLDFAYKAAPALGAPHVAERTNILNKIASRIELDKPREMVKG